MRWALFVLASGLLAGVAGCLPLFYAYPTVSYTPAINFGPDHKGVFAFRVDVTDDSTGAGHYQLKHLPISKSGYLMGQGKSSLDDGYYWNLFVKTYARQVSHTLRVRLYRPGYELAEVQSWHTHQDVEWKEVDGIAGREQAVDALLCTTEGTIEAGPEKQPFAHLDPGSSSGEHRDTLLFAAREYERIAHVSDDQGDTAAADRCIDKARQLHELANR
jgi:hypothetical protein